jgi:hypothetical protein
MRNDCGTDCARVEDEANQGRYAVPETKCRERWFETIVKVVAPLSRGKRKQEGAVPPLEWARPLILQRGFVSVKSTASYQSVSFAVYIK